MKVEATGCIKHRRVTQFTYISELPRWMQIEYFPQPPLNYRSMAETSAQTKSIAQKTTTARVKKDMSLLEMAKYIPSIIKLKNGK